MKKIKEIFQAFQNSRTTKALSIPIGTSGAILSTLAAATTITMPLIIGTTLIGVGALFSMLPLFRKKSEIQKLTDYITFRSDRIESMQFIIIIILIIIFVDQFKDEINAILNFIDTLLSIVCVAVLIFIIAYFTSSDSNKISEEIKISDKEIKSKKIPSIRERHNSFRRRRFYK